MNSKIISMFVGFGLILSSSISGGSSGTSPKNTMSPLANERFNPPKQKKAVTGSIYNSALYQGGHHSSTSLYHGNSSSLSSGSSSPVVRTAPSPINSPPPVKGYW